MHHYDVFPVVFVVLFWHFYFELFLVILKNIAHIELFIVICLNVIDRLQRTKRRSLSTVCLSLKNGKPPPATGTHTR